MQTTETKSKQVWCSISVWPSKSAKTANLKIPPPPSETPFSSESSTAPSRPWPRASPTNSMTSPTRSTAMGTTRTRRRRLRMAGRGRRRRGGVSMTARISEMHRLMWLCHRGRDMGRGTRRIIKRSLLSRSWSKVRMPWGRRSLRSWGRDLRKGRLRLAQRSRKLRIWERFNHIHRLRNCRQILRRAVYLSIRKIILFLCPLTKTSSCHSISAP